jgi:hypothetical protein
MERSQLAEKYKSTVAAIESIENSGDVFLYATKDKYLPKVGHIHEIDSIEGLLKAQNLVMEGKDKKYEAAAAALGLDEKEMPKQSDTLLLGIKTSLWEKDIKTRLAELRVEIKLAKLRKDAELLRRNLNDDDNFKLDMLELSDESL